MTSRIPPLLDSYLSLPLETSLIVLTGILGASTNWLALRYLYSYLKTPPRAAAEPLDSSSTQDGSSSDEVSVLLVSFLRDFTFWREGAGRLGIDLEALARKGRFSFVDGLSGLFLAPSGSGVTTTAAPDGVKTSGRDVLTSPRLQDVSRALAAAIDGLQARRQGKVVLVIDQLDFLLAATGEEEVIGVALRDMVLNLREKVHACIMTLSADEPLISAQTTTLEKEQAAFALSLAHEAEAVLSLRVLDTGAAKDVSGVVRITRGGGDLGTSIEEHEYLYHVGGDGGVRVFERGQ